MSHKLKANQIVWRLGLLLFLFVFVFTSLGASAPVQGDSGSTNLQVVSQYQAAQANPTLSDTQKIKAAINAYFTLRYEGQKVLRAQDFSPLLEDNAQAWVQKEKDKRDIELYIATLFDLKYVSYKYTLDFDSIVINHDQATVLLRESHKVIFESAAPEVSELANLPHSLILQKRGGMWVINADEYQDELSQVLNQATKDDIKKQVYENYQEDLKSKNANSKTGTKKVLANIENLPSLTPYTYVPYLAISYADKYWNSTGPHYRRDPTGDDCANFVAQAIYAGQGRVPPNTSGMAPVGSRNWNYDWYYLFDQKSGPIANAGSYAWVNVTAQSNFLQGNSSRVGPYGHRVISLCYAWLGDVVQIKSGIWFHEGMIVGIYKPPAPNCPSLGNIFIDAHTADRHNYPLSYWTYEFQIIHIDGWRKQSP
ncbi:MAG: amidase domain-containing protein [Anaerolineales bacterium]